MSQVAFDPLTGTMTSTTTQVAQLDSSGQLSGAVIPAEYDDVVSYPSLENFPVPGLIARIYFPADTNVPHRWDTETLSYIPIASDADGGEF